MSDINMIPGLGIAATGLTAQRRRLDVVAQNIANAGTTRSEGGGAYRRQSVALSSTDAVKLPAPANAPAKRVSIATTNPAHIRAASAQLSAELEGVGVRVDGIVTDNSPFPRVYDPTHPDADDEGYVELPNVEILNEMVDLMLATRVYEANLAVLEASKETSSQIINLMG